MDRVSTFAGRDVRGHEAESGPRPVSAVPVEATPVLPDYGGACLSNLMPALLMGEVSAEWVPARPDTGPVVLLVLDGLGWRQLQERAALTPVLGSLAGGPITTVAPSTTATALTSLTTGVPPGEHGVIGYRVREDGEVLNILRWSTPAGDARQSMPPRDLQPVPPFCGLTPQVISRAEFVSSGFSLAHLDGARYAGYRTMSTLETEVRLALARGEQFVYAYWDGIDKVAHEYGLRDHYDAELAECDRLVGRLLDMLPAGATLLVTADHGQVETGDDLIELARPVQELLVGQSGEARFRWLHARPGALHDLEAAAIEHHGGRAWVRTAAQILDEQWFGPVVSPPARRRLGDVALVSSDRGAFVDPADTGPYQLVGRHGSLTADEMLIPLLGATA